MGPDSAVSQVTLEKNFEEFFLSAGKSHGIKGAFWR
jgi:hypothetical protein